MILSDKIVQLRKREGLSQEELARRIGVSRQAVSKWESAQSIPDMNKVLALSEFFGVSTDYLLKDELGDSDGLPLAGENEGGVADDGEELRPVSLELANAFLANNGRNATLVAFGVMLCVFSPIVFIVLSTGSDMGKIALAEDRAASLGLAALVLLVAAAVAVFVVRGIRSREYDWMKTEPLDTAYGVAGMAEERRRRYQGAHARDIAIGVVLCVAACVPLFLVTAAGGADESWSASLGVAALLFLVGVGVFLIVRSATVWGGFQVLLEEGAYTREMKRVSRRIGGIYWGIVVAVYLLASLATMRWDSTWVIWPVAGVLYGVAVQLYKGKSQ